jgi:hypothetical protein
MKLGYSQDGLRVVGEIIMFGHLENGAWIKAVEPFSTHCNQWQDGIKPIEIDKKKQGNVIIRYSDHTGERIVTKSKSIKIAK